ncbi:MAG: DUF4145 domain-containing protein [Candidatus Omnitrophota bacterium]|nr:DUF4145 domain-containing protein [Candidatus Omnitrophota bacterium]
MSGNSWTCPFCGRPTTITESDVRSDQAELTIENKHGAKLLYISWIVCPNDECKEYSLVVTLYDYLYTKGVGWKLGKYLKSWSLIPQASVKIFPDYIPQVILDDYKEACLIKDLSAKASATLARRCLQGMIRNIWEVKDKNLKREIEKIKTKVDPLTWKAIDAVRGIGNIGAHMEKDINVIVDVEPEEASLLINLIEKLIQEWYVNAHEKEKMMQEIIATHANKKEEQAKTPIVKQPQEQKEAV